MADAHLRISRGELAFGLSSGLLGLVILTIVLFAPLGSGETVTASTTTTGPNSVVTVTHSHYSLWSQGIDARAVPFLTAIMAAYIAIAIGTVMHAVWHIRLGSWIRWGGVAIALLGSVVGAMSIGLFLFPAATLGLIAALGGSTD